MQYLTYLLGLLLALLGFQATLTTAFPFHDVARFIVSTDIGYPTDGFNIISVPSSGQVLTVGQTINILWFPTPEYKNQTVTIILLQGDNSSALTLGKNVAASIQSSAATYSWAIDSSLVGYACYGLKLQLDSNSTIFQYSFPFSITSDNGTSITTSSLSSAQASQPASTTHDTQTTSTSDTWTLPSTDSALRSLTSSAPAAWTTNSCWASWISAGNPSFVPPPCADTPSGSVTQATETFTSYVVPVITGTPSKGWNTSATTTTMTQ